MSHPNRFRVWSKTSSKWMSNIVLSAEGTPILMYSEKVDDRVFHRVFLIDNYQPIVQWSIGLKDKNGVEVYEGDILDDGSEVVWDHNKWGAKGGSGNEYVTADHTVVDTVLEKAARAAEAAQEPKIPEVTA